MRNLMKNGRTLRPFCRKTVAVLCAFSILLSVFTVGIITASAASYTAVTTDALRLRSGAGSSYSTIMTMDQGKTVTLLSSSSNGWIRVKEPSGKTGWCSVDYLQVNTASGVKITAETTDYLNLRTGPGTSYSTQGVINDGVTVTVLDNSNESWVKVKTSDSKTGWLTREFLAVSITLPKTENSSSVSESNPLYSNTEAPDWFEQANSSGSSLYLSQSAMTLEKGDANMLTAFMSSVSGAQTAVTWKSSNSSVAAVTAAGKVQAVAAGTAVITATHKGSGKTAKCTVTVTEVKIPVSKVTLNTNAIKWPVGRSGSFTATVLPTNATNKAVTWKSSDTKVATVSSAGKLTAVAPGMATITCTAQDGSGKYATCEVTVTKPVVKVTSVTLNTNAISWPVGRSGSFTATVLPSDATDKSVTWKSSNTKVATVSSAGKLTAVAPGTATITCTAQDGSGKYATCKVTVKSNTEVSNITLSATATSIYINNHAYIKATTTPAGKAVTYTSSNTSVATVSSKGVVTGKSAGSAVITVKDSAGAVKKTITIRVTAAPSGYVNLSNTTASVPVSKSFYLKSYTSGTTWTTSDSSVATISSQGYLLAKKEGVAIITAKASGKVRTCAVTVTQAAPVRFAYTSPNSATLNDKVSFIAITDTDRDAVKFEFTANGKQYTVSATSKSLDSKGHYIWKGSITFKFSGSFTVTAFSSKNGAWSTCNDGKTSVFVSNVASPSTVSFDERRASDEILELNSDYEGFLSSVTDDPLVTNAPTLGYGKVITPGEQFYNNLSRDEAYAYLVQTMNSGSYTAAVNNFMQTNNIKFNQQQFDALVMLVYNLGAGVLSDSYVKGILLDCYETSSTTSATVAYVNSSDGLWLRTGPGTGYSSILAMPYNTKVTVVEKTNSQWYKVKLSDGTQGYCASQYLTFAFTGVRNLNKVDKDDLIAELIQWHHAGGQCVWGLLYRRIDELEVFFYNDYVRDGSSNKYNMPYRWNC